MTTVLFCRVERLPHLLLDTLRTLGHKVLIAVDEKSLLALLADNQVDAVIAFDEDLECIKGVIKRYPLTNYALISDREEQDFHAVTEGYGFFMQIHQPLSAEEVRLFTDTLQTISRISAPSQGVQS